MKRNEEDETDETGAPPASGAVTASSSYALFQLARALTQSETHSDPAVAERLRRKAATWQKVFSGMVSGQLEIGSRTPVSNVPAWATLEVATGGFATGALLAGGDVRPHEIAILQRLQRQDVATRSDAARGVLNTYFCSEAGFAELRALLHSGCYRIEVPEEGALLVVAWLVENGHHDRAHEVLDAITPFFSRLRFYPLPHPHPYAPSSVVHIETVKETSTRIADMQERPEIKPQREAQRVWNPYLDRLVALFLETVEGELPRVELGANQRPARRPDGSWALSGGWPCQKFPAGWTDRARAALADFTRLRAQNHSSNKPERDKENLAQLRKHLTQCVEDPRALTGRDVGMIRMILAHILAVRGLPDSPRCRELRQAQAAQAARPTKKELSVVILARLAGRPQDGGIDAVEPLLDPVSDDEAQRFKLPAGQGMPPALRRPLLRCLNAPVKTLVDEKLIKSSEMLARVLPQLVSQVGASGIADPDLRRLYGALYEAFRKRRSLLLLNLERQVRLQDLPWVAALSAFREGGADQRAKARAVLTELVMLALTAFPQAILPNKLLQEIRTLCERAGLEIPIVDEIAADIFMGEFTGKYVDAAQRAAQLLKGSLYEHYYGISYERVLRIDDVEPAYSRAAPTSKMFLRLCAELAGQRSESRRSVAANGALLEQEQIVTTHNLAVLVDALELRAPLAPQLGELTRRCFTWLCTELQHEPASWRARLHAIKNAAYAFRQMVFFLSLEPQAAVEEFVTWAIAHLAEQQPAFAKRFQPALNGLLRAACNEYPESPPDSRRFVGWSEDRHWLNAKP